jgi:hypothetical protein
LKAAYKDRKTYEDREITVLPLVIAWQRDLHMFNSIPPMLMSECCLGGWC